MPLFGTDGVRGLANGILTADLALTLAQATAVVLGQGRTAEARKAEGKRLSAVVARDPRISGEFLVAAVSAGLAASGVDVLDAGVIPTPALAFLVADHDADFGVMVSASHNPAPDNGIKIFARGGVKLPDEVEARIEAAMSGDMLLPTGEGVGRIQRFSDAEDRYKLHLLGSLPHSLDGIHVVLDCAHGAASGVSPETFRTAGAEVTVIGAEPDGININDGVGSTHLDNLAEAVVRLGADVGIAHDGDADRCLAVDADGNTIDGDQIMAVLAVAMKERGHLADDTLVATVMSNLGLHMAMKEHGIAVRQTAVGDRYVLEDMNAGGYSLGGEQSGHVIMSEFATTGDGLLSGLHLVAEMARQKKTLAELASVMTVYPQVLINVRGVDKDRVADDEGVQSAVASVEAELGETGRVLLRKSGTEPLVRVMVEAADAESAQSYAEKLADVVRDRLAL
ncbi:phosphoglucosamine mutase [uncultured Microbacterium sp.]|uniref:phosphoglucosamine mutase n=1 Tax=uncultured Microbacterium sp. TaxID=191216 RepID=UPI00260EB3DA|nr:phosphoglucosamine mutase [uncultured Microbacterium sp.]